MDDLNAHRIDLRKGLRHLNYIMYVIEVTPFIKKIHNLYTFAHAPLFPILCDKMVKTRPSSSLKIESDLFCCTNFFLTFASKLFMATPCNFVRRMQCNMLHCMRTKILHWQPQHYRQIKLDSAPVTMYTTTCVLFINHIS